MKKDRKKSKMIEEEVDLSIIKKNDLEDTASFTDLMSRKERKKHKKEKEDLTEEFEVKKLEDSMEFETEDLASQIAENKTVEITEDEVKELMNADLSKEDELEDINDSDFKEEKEHKNIFNTVLISLVIIVFIGLFVYAIINTKYLEKDLYLIIDGALLILLVFNYCLMTIVKKPTFFTILNYLLIVGTIAFNTLIYFKII
ncbi:MAG: hypothetical protein IKN87_01840 [Bacilli bacterium]|nr:hypothetical protein [Bacilli bacterium]